jgi:hypothetical protein
MKLIIKNVKEEDDESFDVQNVVYHKGTIFFNIASEGKIKTKYITLENVFSFEVQP